MAAVDRDGFGDDLTALLDRLRTTRREGAAGRQVREVGRRAGNGDKAAALFGGVSGA